MGPIASDAESAKKFFGGIRISDVESAAETLGLLEWWMRADVFQSLPRRKFRQSAADPPWSEVDCRGTNFVRRVRGGFRVGNFYPPKNFFGGFRVGGNRTHSDSGGLNRSPPRNCSATRITETPYSMGISLTIHLISIIEKISYNEFDLTLFLQNE